MAADIRVGITGKRDPENHTHVAANQAPAHAARAVGVFAEVERLLGDALEERASAMTRGFDVLF